MKNVVDKLTKLLNQTTKFPSKMTACLSVLIIIVHDNVALRQENFL